MLFLGVSACGQAATPHKTGAAPSDGVATQQLAPSKTPPAPVEAAQPRVIFKTRGGEVTVDAEVVRTPRELQQGLMYRRHLPDGDGMIFIMPTERIQSFWMKNTYIPLDMIFVSGSRRVVGIVRAATPHTLDQRRVETPSRFVIEVPGGFAARSGIETGDAVALEHIPNLP